MKFGSVASFGGTNEQSASFLIHQFVKVFFYESFALYGSPVMLALVPNLVCSDEMNSAEHVEIQGNGFIVL